MWLSVSVDPLRNRPPHTEPVGMIAWVFRREVGDRCHDRESVARRRAAASEVALGQISNHAGLAPHERQGVYDGALSASIRADDRRLLVEDELAVANGAKSCDSQFGNSHRLVFS